MRPTTRRRALRATAKVAWAALALGCGADAQPPAEPVAATDATATDSPADDAPTPTPATSVASPVPTASAAADTDLTACHERVKNAVGAKSEPKDAPAEDKACCTRIAEEHHADLGMKWEQSERGYCCAALGWDSGRACTPWGPPPPPELATSRPSGQTQREVLDLRGPAEPYMPRLGDPGPLREAAIATWHGRMVNEHQSARVFEGLAEQLADAGVDGELVAQCASFAHEERRHGVLCGAVVEALGGEAFADAELPAAFPAHADAATPLEAALRSVLSVCCLSETVAVALIGAERLDMQDGALRELLTRIYADEVGHARFGWRLIAETLSKVDGVERARLTRALSDYLAVAFDHLERHELAHLPVASTPPPEGAALGLCDGTAARGLFYDTLRTVIIPALEHLDLDARAAWHARAA